MAPTPPRLLIADADPDTRALLTLLLTADAYHVDTAPSLEEAGAYAAERADLILADGCCATFDALAAAAPRIRAAAGGTPILLLSALPLDPATAHAHGLRDVLPKPFDIDELLCRVRTALADGASA